MANSKSPAVLFYTGDFLADTTLWNYDELGRYIKLLCIQHLQDGISEDDFQAVANGCKRILDKFNVGDDGLYRNKRMAEEIEKRKAFSEKQRANGLKPKRSQTEAKPKPNSNPRVENENVNEDVIKDVITYLNEVLSTKYKHNADYIKKHINARISEGYTLEDFKTVIDKKYRSWSGTEMAKFLRPETLFGTKFASYLNELEGEEEKNGRTKEPYRSTELYGDYVG